MFTFGIGKDEYHLWICRKWYVSFFVSVKYQLTNQIKSNHPTESCYSRPILLHLGGCPEIFHCILDIFLFNLQQFSVPLSKCPNQLNSHRRIRWYVINKMVKYPGKLFTRFGMISKLLSTFLPPLPSRRCGEISDAVRYLTASGLLLVYI